MSFYRWIKLQHLKTSPPDICLAWLAHRRHWSHAVVTSLQLITFEIEFWLSCSNRCHSQICFPLPPSSLYIRCWRETLKASLARHVVPSINATCKCKMSWTTAVSMSECYVLMCAVMLYWHSHNAHYRFMSWKYSEGRNPPWICNRVHVEHARNVSFISFLSILFWPFPISLPPSL